VDECEDIASDYEITAMPTFVFIKNKKKVSDYCFHQKQAKGE
jgi:thioredoxin-related protein